MNQFHRPNLYFTCSLALSPVLQEALHPPLNYILLFTFILLLKVRLRKYISVGSAKEEPTLSFIPISMSTTLPTFTTAEQLRPSPPHFVLLPYKGKVIVGRGGGNLHAELDWLQWQLLSDTECVARGIERYAWLTVYKKKKPPQEWMSGEGLLEVFA